MECDSKFTLTYDRKCISADIPNCYSTSSIRCYECEREYFYQIDHIRILQ